MYTCKARPHAGIRRHSCVRSIFAVLWLKLHTGHDSLTELIHSSCRIFAICYWWLVKAGEVENSIFYGTCNMKRLQHFCLERDNYIFERTYCDVIASFKSRIELLVSVLAMFAASRSTLSSIQSQRKVRWRRLEDLTSTSDLCKILISKSSSTSLSFFRFFFSLRSLIISSVSAAVWKVDTIATVTLRISEPDSIKDLSTRPVAQQWKFVCSLSEQLTQTKSGQGGRTTGSEDQAEARSAVCSVPLTPSRLALTFCHTNYPGLGRKREGE